jgi:hypothetical protein
MKRNPGAAVGGWLLALALLVAALLAACADKPTPRFPHRQHLAELSCNAPGKPACLTCNSCHTPSQPERAYKLPPASLCQSCHKDGSTDLLASLYVEPPRPYGEIAIDHARHLALQAVGGQCVTCHAGVVEPGKSTLPPMERCFQCHEHEQQWQRAQCSPCHQAADLRKSLPRTFLQHDAQFLRRHGDLSAFDQSLCQTCHTQSDCQACHDVSQDLTAEARTPERIESTSFHRGDFMTRHALEASAAPTRCATCHAPETCDSCHVERGVSGNRFGSRNPHPPGWVGNSAGAKSAHGIEARRDILSCAACHDQGPATNCIRCHSVGAYGGNPHPSGWQSARSPSDQMCRYCHG